MVKDKEKNNSSEPEKTPDSNIIDFYTKMDTEDFLQSIDPEIVHMIKSLNEHFNTHEVFVDEVKMKFVENVAKKLEKICKRTNLEFTIEIKPDFYDAEIIIRILEFAAVSAPDIKELSREVFNSVDSYSFVALENYELECVFTISGVFYTDPKRLKISKDN